MVLFVFTFVVLLFQPLTITAESSSPVHDRSISPDSIDSSDYVCGTDENININSTAVSHSQSLSSSSMLISLDSNIGSKSMNDISLLHNMHSAGQNLSPDEHNSPVHSHVYRIPITDLTDSSSEVNSPVGTHDKSWSDVVIGRHAGLSITACKQFSDDSLDVRLVVERDTTGEQLSLSDATILLENATGALDVKVTVVIISPSVSN